MGRQLESLFGTISFETKVHYEVVARNFKDGQDKEQAKKADLRKWRSWVTLWTIVVGTLIRIWQRFKKEEENSGSVSSGKCFSATTLGIFNYFFAAQLPMSYFAANLFLRFPGRTWCFWMDDGGRDMPPLCQFQQRMRVAQWVKNGDKALITCRQNGRAKRRTTGARNFRSSV